MQSNIASLLLTPRVDHDAHCLYQHLKLSFISCLCGNTLPTFLLINNSFVFWHGSVRPSLNHSILSNF